MRLIVWAGALTLGIAGSLLAAPQAHLLALLAPLPLCAALWLIRKAHQFSAEVLAACYIGLYVGARALQPLALDRAVALAVDSDQKVLVQGWVLTAPEPAPQREGSRLRVAVHRIQGEPARATAAVSVAAGIPALMPGDPVQFQARLRGLRGLANPGLPDTTLQMRANGIDVFAGVGAHEAIRRWPVGTRERSPVERGFAAMARGATGVRLALGGAIDQVASGSAARFLHTAVLGERRHTDAVVEDGFRAAGATHVLSVSGLHLAAVAVIFFAGAWRALALVPRLPLWIEPRAAAAWIAIPAVGFYTLITGSAIATVRSALMMTFALAGIAVGRRGTPLVAIAAAVLLLLVWSPLVLVDISFQLSVVSVVALAVLVPRLSPAPSPIPSSGPASLGPLAARWLRVPAKWLLGFGMATLAAGAATGPIVAHHFGEVTPAAPAGNLLLVPLVELVVVPCGLFGAAIGALFGRTLSLPLLTIADAGARAALAIAEYFRGHAPVWLTRAPNVFETAALCAGLGAMLAAARRARPGPNLGLLFGGLCLLAAASSIGVRDIVRRYSRDLVVTFLDIGQGDAALVELPGGRTVLIDGGGTYDGSFDPGARVVEPFLRARGITRLDMVALSHPHPDHLGGLHRVLSRFDVSTLWTSGDDGRNPEYWRLLTAARARGVALPVPAPWQVNGVSVQPLGPFVVGAGGDRIGVPEGTTVNDASLIIRAQYGKRAVLFTGDIEENGEGELAGRTAVGQMVTADILKVPHHGSRTSSTPDLLDAVRPRLAVMSLGWKNRFRFPRPEVVERYRDRGIRVFRTDLDGAITIRLTPDGEVVATCERGCR